MVDWTEGCGWPLDKCAGFRLSVGEARLILYTRDIGGGRWHTELRCVERAGDEHAVLWRGTVELG